VNPIAPVGSASFVQECAGIGPYSEEITRLDVDQAGEWRPDIDQAWPKEKNLIQAGKFVPLLLCSLISAFGG